MLKTYFSEMPSLGREGFTLIEILMVITLISILAKMGVTQYIDFGNDARTQVTTDKLNALKAAIIGDARLVAGGQYSSPGYETHCTAPPVTLADLITQPGSGTCAAAYDPFTKRGWRGPYISNSDSLYNKDAWGTTLQYYVTGPPARTIRSCGLDASCGNSDDITVTY